AGGVKVVHLYPFWRQGGREDFHRGFVSEGSPGLFRRHEPARGCASVWGFPRQRSEDVGVLGSAWIPADGAGEAAEAGWVHRDHRWLAGGGSRGPSKATAHGEAGIRAASR